jgi:hypothetical protein
LRDGAVTGMVCGMAWRIEESVIRGEIDNRVRGRVTGRIWVAGLSGPLDLDLKGNAWRDLAGRRLEFSNPAPKPLTAGHKKFSLKQTGVIGDCTASRKVKVPEVSMDELLRLYEEQKPFPWHWGNSLYLEWLSDTLGRVVIESADYTLTISPESAWDMTAEEEQEQRKENTRSIEEFFGNLGPAGGKAGSETGVNEDKDAWKDDEPMSEAEAEKLQDEGERLADRIQARLDREGPDADYEKILEEELERCERERGDRTEKPLTPDQEAVVTEWLDEFQRDEAEDQESAEKEEADADEDEDELARQAKMDDEFENGDDDDHPLSKRGYDLAVKLMQEPYNRGWVPTNAREEHPLIELGAAAAKAGAKLAGALNGEDWPPDRDECAVIIVRLKRAHGYLEDALRAVEDCIEQKLGDTAWMADVQRELKDMAREAEALIVELRARLEGGGS